MKNNTAVTQKEYLLNNKTTLLSTTDKDSHITYAKEGAI